MDSLSIDIDDYPHAAKDSDGYWAVKVDQRAFVEPPRWITFSGCSRDDEQRALALADAAAEVAAAMRRQRVRLAV